ncbi:SHQ1 protein-domain-containing protein [Entophlyctis helioformis]|nr:SHQ1 protein-domain-containing protein [Entophlyctis helioformis]
MVQPCGPRLVVCPIGKMLTPRFSLTQTDEFIELQLECPYIKAQEVEIDVDGCDFKFFAHPYFLRLTMPHRLIEDGRERSSYDIGTGIVSLKIPKETLGQQFEDLDLLTKLMDIKSPAAAAAASSSSGPSASADQAAAASVNASVNATISAMMDAAPARMAAGPLIQEMDAPTDGLAQEHKPDQDEQEIDWNYPQQIPEPLNMLSGAKYGFNNQYSGFAASIHQVAHEVLDVVDLDQSTPESRRQDRIAFEDDKFDEEHYIFDMLNNDDEIQRIMRFKPASWKALKEIQQQAQAGQGEQPAGSSDASRPVHAFLEFTEQEQEQMRRLSNRSYILDLPVERSVYLGLVDILFGHCYNLRFTEGDDTPESAWTICKLSGTLSCFDNFTHLSDVVACCLRRSLTYPLYRHFGLSKRVLEDVVILLKLGRRAILKALLHIKRLLEHDEVTFVLDRVWVTDYCVWIQHASDKRLRQLASELHHFQVTKDLTGWPLEEYEALGVEDAAERDQHDNPMDADRPQPM